MKIRISLYLLFCFASATGCKAQNNFTTKTLSNKSFHYLLLRTKSQLLDTTKIELSKTVVISQLPNSVKDRLKQIDKETWMKLLKDESTDWASNLFLYEVNGIDASTFQVIKNKEDWRVCCKNEDLNFWEKKLLKK